MRNFYIESFKFNSRGEAFRASKILKAFTDGFRALLSRPFETSFNTLTSLFLPAIIDDGIWALSI